MKLTFEGVFRGRPRGSMLIGVMAIVFMLMTVVMALHYYQGVSRQAYMVAEADLRFREGTRYQMEKQAVGTATIPSDLAVTATVDNVTPSNTVSIGNNVAVKLFDRTAGLPDLSGAGPAHSFLKLTPQTSDIGLKVFGNKTYTAVLSSVPGYAAFAPAGSVNITDLRGWSNPSFTDPRKSTEAYSGVPAVVAGLLDVTSDTVTYGELHTVNGTAKINSGQGVGYKAPQFPFKNYADETFQHLETAKGQLVSNALSGDKTTSLSTTEVGPDIVLNLLFGGSNGIQSFLSLRNATHFWLPMIPGFCPSPPYLFEFYFSVPYPPDNASYDSGTAKQAKDDLQAIQTQMVAASQQVEITHKAAVAANVTYTNDPSIENQKALLKAEADFNQANAVLQGLQDQAKSKTQQFGNLTDQSANNSMAGIPPTRSKDPSGDSGQFGWNYSVCWKIFSSLIEFIFTFNPKDFATKVSNDSVTLVHFGGKDREFHFDLGGTNMVIDATMNVPRGRTLKLTSPGTITVRGDLWLQRGSTLVLDCTALNLECPPGNSSSNSYFTPCGRIFLEEGASLVCTGDVNVPGSTDWGSVVVGGVPGQIHPITASIMAKNVKLDNGVFAGTTIDDLTNVLVKDVPSLKTVNDKLLTPLLNNVAPNAAKIAGPFWARKPYFAQYATTFQVILPPLPPFGEPGPPIPTPIPLPHTNVLNPVAEALGYIYSVTLNVAMGENFYTHCDWWIFGEGVVPLLPQVDPNGVKNLVSSLPTLALDVLDPKAILTNIVTNLVQQVITEVVQQVVQAVVAKVIEIIPYAGIGGALDSLLDSCLGVLKNKMNSTDSIGQSLVGSITSSVADAGKSTLTNLQSKIEMKLQDTFLREYNGLLVYGDSIQIAGKNASGMFVATHNINVSAERCVGTLMSQKGNINCSSLLYYPYFNRASLYLPKTTDSGWLGRAAEYNYDSAFNSNMAVDIAPPSIPAKISAQGWTR